MGLIGGFLTTLFWKMNGFFLAPFQFLKRPQCWLQALTDHGGTLTGAPNFAIAYCTSRITPEQRQSLNLSKLKNLVLGAEPINLNVLKRFAEHFSPAGFRFDQFTPGFGMAEASLMISMRRRDAPFVATPVSRQALAEQRLAPPASTDDEVTFVGCGSPVLATDIEVRDEDGRALGENQLGRIWIRSPSVTEGYHDCPELNAEVFKDGWLDTGDQGFFASGQLHLTGRYKDIVIIHGQNYVPTDFEQVAAEVEPIKEGRVVAFGDIDPVSGSEGLVLICGLGDEPVDQDSLRQNIAEHVATKTGVMPIHVGFIPAKMMPRTTSGKLQRAKVKSLFQRYRQ
jgi:acyl-CoA synthetase (AMP-forming)/AMP-acid ligase II